MTRRAGLVVFTLLTSACAARGPVRADTATPPPVALAGQAVAGHVAVLPADDAAYPRADVKGAVRPPGEGNVSTAVVVRVTTDVTVYRMWSGPQAKDANGRTNRIGSWWTYDPPTGTQQSYRQRYEICVGWNTLSWVVTCTLKAGAVVAVGPGNSVSAATCGDASGKESYPANPKDWQLYVAKAYDRIGPGKELDCPSEAADYAAEPTDLSRHRGTP